jgi:hypothetical protein
MMMCSSSHSQQLHHALLASTVHCHPQNSTPGLVLGGHLLRSMCFMVTVA